MNLRNSTGQREFVLIGEQQDFLMPRRFILENVYTSAEYDPRYPASLRAIGQLLDAAIDGVPPNPDIERLLAQLDASQPTRH